MKKFSIVPTLIFCLAAAALAQDTRLKILEQPKPELPQNYLTLDVQGTVVLKIQFLDFGEIGEITALKTLPNGLTERADLMLVAPATNNVIAKVATGLCDDLVSLMVCAAACPVVFAPAMNNRMWDHPVAQENVAKLRALGYRFIGPDAGWLACRNVGAGRLSEPAKIIDEVIRLLAESSVASQSISKK